MIQRKSPLSGGGLPGKLADCSDKDAEKCELFIVEEILQRVQPSRDVIVHSRLSSRCAERS